jgi:hypothetical protein
MRVFIAALAFAALVGALFWWRLPSHSIDAAPAARDPATLQSGRQMGPLEQATNRQGRDLSDVGMRLTDAAACSRLCAADDRCMAMSFVKSADAGSGLCWLKGSVPGATENAAVVSAVKIVADQ